LVAEPTGSIFWTRIIKKRLKVGGIIKAKGIGWMRVDVGALMIGVECHG